MNSNNQHNSNHAEAVWAVQHTRFFVRTTTILFIFAVYCSLSATAKANEQTSIINPARPNIVLIMADDMGWGDTGYDGNFLARTPHLNAMVKGGVRLNRFYAASPHCSPTRGSVLTGRHPYRYGIYYVNVGSLPKEETTLAEVLLNAGYRTGLFGKWHVGTMSRYIPDPPRGGKPSYVLDYSPPWHHGFQTVFATEGTVPTYDPMLKPKNITTQGWWNVIAEDHKRADFGRHYWNEDGQVVSDNLRGDDTRVIVDRVIPFIRDAVEADTPFLAVVWAHAPHTPLVAAHGDRKAIPSKSPYLSSYYGSIRAMDRQIGRIRDELRDLGIADNTMVWFTSDNGGTAKTRRHLDRLPHLDMPLRLRDTKKSLYEGGIRVSSVIEWPLQFEGGTEISAPMATSDILPTIADYLGIQMDLSVELDGISLRPLLSGERNQRGSGIGFESNRQLAFIGDRYKLIHVPKQWHAKYQHVGYQLFGQNPNKDPNYEVYDLLKDPGETTDLAGEDIEEISELKEALNQWRQSVEVSINDYESKRTDIRLVSHHWIVRLKNKVQKLLRDAKKWLDIKPDKEFSQRNPS